MALQTFAFTGCCTARIITGFGQTNTASVNTLMQIPEDQLDQELQEIESAMARGGSAVAVVTLNDDQVNAIRVLKRRGWKHSKWMTKRAHSDKKLRLYYKPLEG